MLLQPYRRGGQMGKGSDVPDVDEGGKEGTLVGQLCSRLTVQPPAVSPGPATLARPMLRCGRGPLPHGVSHYAGEGRYGD